MSRIFIQEPDRIRIVEERRARRAGWVLMTALVIIFTVFILERLT